MSEDENFPTFSSVIEYGREVIKTATLINGGASIALLAFIGNIWSKKPDHDAINLLAIALVCFSSGIVFAGASSLLSYIWHQQYHSTRAKLDELKREIEYARNEIHLDPDEMPEAYDELENKIFSLSKKAKSNTPVFISIFFSFAFFIFGMGISVRAIVEHFSA